MAADNRDPPPLFDEDVLKDEDNDDLFASAVQSPVNGSETPEKSVILDIGSSEMMGESKTDPLPSAKDASVTSSHPLTDPLQALGSFESKPDVSSQVIEEVANFRISSSNDMVDEKSQHPDLTDSLSSNISNLPPVPRNMYNISSIDSMGPQSMQDSNMDLFESALEDSFVKPFSSVSLADNTVVPQHQEVSLDDDDDGLFSGALDTSKVNTLNETVVPSSTVLPPVGVPITPPQVETAPSIPPASAYDYSANSVRSSAAQVDVSPTNSQSDPDQFIEISISEPQKVGDGMGSYMAYKMTTRTNIPYFKKQSWSVTRRFSDYLGLHSKLVEKHLHAGKMIPPAPEKDAVNSTKLKLGTSDSTDGAAEFLERRRATLQRFMQRTASLPHLRSDPDFREFIELDSELPKATQTSAMSGAGVMRFFNKMGETVNKIAFKMEESDQWFEDRVNQMEALEVELRRLHLSLEGLHCGRRELALCSNSLSKAAAVLSSVEEHSSLSRALHQLAEATDRTHTVYHAQADADFYILCETTRDYINLIGAAKEVLHERVKVYQAWNYAQTMCAKKREAKAKLELAARHDKISLAHQEVLDWESKVEKNKENFELISVTIKKELEQFDVQRVQDFKDMLVKYLEAMVTSQQQVIKVWEAFLPEAKAIS